AMFRRPPACSQGMLLTPQVDCYPTVNDTIYSYGALTLDGDEYIPFERYKGKTVLFVNCRCGGVPSSLLTHFWLSLHAELNALQDELRDQEFVVLGFPSNQFGKQEPGQNSEILPALKYVRPGGGFVPNFQLFQKGDVNGAKEQKIFTFLKNACPPVAEEFGNPNKLFWEPLRNHDINLGIPPSPCPHTEAAPQEAAFRTKPQRLSHTSVLK
uniref:glutathione peroxidase n=1 Tax=Cyanoderma ruficeps TaxID=181631 RepID=A0A8C3QFN7_9PASS